MELKDIGREKFDGSQAKRQYFPLSILRYNMVFRKKLGAQVKSMT